MMAGGYLLDPGNRDTGLGCGGILCESFRNVALIETSKGDVDEAGE